MHIRAICLFMVLLTTSDYMAGNVNAAEWKFYGSARFASFYILYSAKRGRSHQCHQRRRWRSGLGSPGEQPHRGSCRVRCRRGVVRIRRVRGKCESPAPLRYLELWQGLTPGLTELDSHHLPNFQPGRIHRPGAVQHRRPLRRAAATAQMGNRPISAGADRAEHRSGERNRRVYAQCRYGLPDTEDRDRLSPCVG